MWTVPPPPGLLTFEIDLKPVSLQSAPKLRQGVKSQVAHFVKASEYLLSGEVEVGVTWILHERERYYGVHSPDIDNILKPLLDGMSGPDGILVNDCQVQSVRCDWIDWTSDDHRLQFEVRFSPDDWVPKKSLLWVDVQDKLCMPLNTDVPTAAQRLLIERWERMFEGRRHVLEELGNYEVGKYFMSVQMPFHRARLRGYEVVSLDEMKRRLNQGKSMRITSNKALQPTAPNVAAAELHR